MGFSYVVDCSRLVDSFLCRIFDEFIEKILGLFYFRYVMYFIIWEKRNCELFMVKCIFIEED